MMTTTNNRQRAMISTTVTMIVGRYRLETKATINKLDEWLWLLEERMRLAVIEAEKVRVKVECNEERSRRSKD